MTGKESKGTLKSVEKALQILEAFSINNPELSAAELEEKLSLPKVSIYRFLRVLQKRGFIMQNSQTREYRLGIKVFELWSQLWVLMRLSIIIKYHKSVVYPNGWPVSPAITNNVSSTIAI